MEIDPITDTIMNIQVFAFIGLMVWLYFRKGPGDRNGGSGGD